MIARRSILPSSLVHSITNHNSLRGSNRMWGVWRIRFAIGLIGVWSTLAVIRSAAQNGPDRNSVLNHLNAVIGWYRDAAAIVQPGELPSDAIFQQNVRSLASQSVQLAFDSARAEAVLLGESTAPSGNNGAPTQDYAQMQAQVSKAIADNQEKLEALKKQISTESGTKRKA